MLRLFYGFCAVYLFCAKFKAAIFEKRTKKFSETAIVIDNEYRRYVSPSILGAIQPSKRIFREPF